MIKMQYDFLDNDIPIFGLHPIVDGKCSCGDEDCQTTGKHPIASGWQHTPLWSEDQLDCMESMGHFDTGYGVLVSGLLVIDVDARNGGVESFERLCADLEIDLLGESGLAVATGSGNGSMHLYFRAPSVALMQHHEKYAGIDFKSSGYVVGPESLHASGNRYEVIHGSPSKITDAPETLIDLLKKPEHYRAKYDGATIDVTEKDLAAMLSHIDPDCDHETWYRCGMAVHHATGGAGIDIWSEWSARGEKYPGFDTLQKRWHSFGKSSNPVTIGTLIHYAKQNGWQSSYDDVTFSTTLTADDLDIEVATIDPKRPPGFVGEVCDWINSQCLYPRESLAVAAALTAVGNIVGLRYIDEHDGMSTNLFAFCVAGSSTGKEAVQQAYMQIMRAAGIAGALHGALKSEQEVVRNLIRHQMAAYTIDELGITLKKIKNAQQRGGASYLEGLIGILMSAYSKANGFMPVSGDVREEITQILQREASAIQKRIDNMEHKGGDEDRLERILHALANIYNGLEAPFLSIIGFTTPVTFNDLADYEQATNGFLSRALIFNDLETNPRRKSGFRKLPLPDSIKYTLCNLYAPGEFDTLSTRRIEHYGTKAPIRTNDAAAALLDTVYELFWQQAEQHKAISGLEAIPRRGYELVAKVSTILAAPGGVRTVEHVRWAYAVVKADIEYKLKLAYANIKDEQDEKTDAVHARIMNCITKDHGETMAVIINRCRPHSKELVEKSLNFLVENGIVAEVETVASNNRRSIKYFQV